MSQEEAQYTREEVAMHSTPTDFWTVIDGVVYNVDEEFVTQMHPGGFYILEAAGKDGSILFEDNHSANAREVLAQWRIGTLKTA